MRAIKIDSVTTLQTIAGGAVIKQGTTTFYSDSAVLNPRTHVIEAFGNIHINQADSIHTYGQYLKYLGVEKMAYIKKQVKLTDRKGTVTTDDLDYNLQTGVGNFYNGGRVSENKTVITSIDGTYYADTKDVYFKRNVKLDDPKNHVRADSLLYNMNTKKASFISETHIKNADVDINTSQGSYDLNTGDAFFTERTTVRDSSGRVYTANNIALENKTGNAQLEGNAVIVDTTNNFLITANQIFLNKKNNSFLATRKPVLIVIQKDDSTYIAADTIFSGITTVVEKAEMALQKDSAIDISPQQDQRVQEVKVNDSIGRRNLPVLDSLQIPKVTDSLMLQKDSLISPEVILQNKGNVIDSADTLKAISPPPDSISTEKDLQQPTGTDSTLKIPEAARDTLTADSAIRYFLAFRNVRIFNDSLQSVCDSLFFSGKDSVFRLYRQPIVWSGNSQISGDTMYLFTKNKEPERLYAFENGFIINRTREGFFNQMAGKTINGYFLNGKIDYLRVKGSQAESIYYMQDEDSLYIGMNRATGDVIEMFFRNDDLFKVNFINAVNGNMYPMGQVPDDQKMLKNFNWQDARRPKNKLELFE